ncbi:MAG: TusE/DsrC/DsvC family sulfur relay protein [Nitrospirota bacterium]
MPVLEIDGKRIELDEEGYLVNEQDWNESVACAIADKEGVSAKCPLTAEKMEILRFMRQYYKQFSAVPIPRAVCKNVHQPRECTYEEFPDPTIAWKIAGLPQPSRHVVAQLKGLGGVS